MELCGWKLRFSAMNRTVLSRIRADVADGLELCERGLGRRSAGWLLLGILALVYTTVYLHHPLYPGNTSAKLRLGWWSWADQFAYWQSAAELAQFHLTAANFHYPLGYPALGALFWRIMPTHAFFVPDLLLVLAATAVWWRLVRGWLSRMQTLVVGVVFVAVHGDVLALTLVIPWNTIVTQLTLLTGMWVMVATHGPCTVWRLTGLAALTYLVRPGDAACFAPMLIWAVLRLPVWRQRLICAAGGMAAIGAVILAMGLINHAVFGTWDTPYERQTWQGSGFFSYPSLSKLFWLFVDGRPFFGEADTALFFRYPWLFLVIPGVFYWVRTAGMAAMAALATLAMNWWLYINYNDFLPSAIFRYSLIHYISWGFAPLFALSFAALLRGWRQQSTWTGLAVAGGLMIFSLGLQMEERELHASVSPGRIDHLPVARPLWVKFPGVSLESVTKLRLDGRQMREGSDFQIPYVHADLRVMLSSRAVGATLVLPVEKEADNVIKPVIGDYVWRWRFEPARWRGISHY